MREEEKLRLIQKALEPLTNYTLVNISIEKIDLFEYHQIVAKTLENLLKIYGY